MNVSNLITALRFPLLVLLVLLLYFGGALGQLITAFLIIVLILWTRWTVLSPASVASKP